MIHPKRPHLALLSAVTLVVGVSCDRRESATGQRTQMHLAPVEARNNDGWTAYELTADGFVLSLPAAWLQLNLKARKFESVLDAALKQNPQLEARADELKRETQAGLKFFAFEQVERADDFPANVKVSRLRLPPGTTGEGLIERVVKDLNAAPAIASPIQHGRVHLPAGECERLHYQRALQLSNGTGVAAEVTQYIFFKDREYLLLTMMTSTERAKGLAPIFERVAHSFRLLN